MTSLADLTRAHSPLRGDDVDHLHRLVAEWAFLADLCFADLLLYVRAETGKWLVVDQVGTGRITGAADSLRVQVVLFLSLIWRPPAGTWPHSIL